MPGKIRGRARRLLRRWGLPLNVILLALPLLVFWLLVALGLFFISLGLLCLLGVQTADKEVSALVGMLIATAIGFAVQQWNTLDQAEKERRDLRQRALEEIEGLRESLRSGDYAHALSLYQAFRKRLVWGAWQELEVEQALENAWLAAPSPLRVWADLCEGLKGLKSNWECIEALVWAWRLGEDKAGQKLDEVISGETLCQVSEVLQSDPAGVLLLRSPAIGRRLDALRGKELSAEQKKCLEDLTTLRQRPVRLPLPWRGAERPPDPREIREAVERLGLQDNPFGPEQAELDPRLKDYGIWPRSLDQARGPRPALVFGPSGSGKTAAALLLTLKCLSPPASPEEGNVFPVWLGPVVEAWPEASAGWLELIGRALAEALLQVSALDPYALFEQEAGVASAIAFLLSKVFGAGALDQHLRRAGLQDGARHYVLSEIRRWAGELASETHLDEYTSLDLIGKARPAELACTYVFLDLPNGLRVRSPSTAASLASLLEMGLPLASRGVYLKVFLPECLQGDLAGFWFEEPLSLTWQGDELSEMLSRRLHMVGLDSLAQICDSPARRLDPDQQLVHAAGGLPRELVRLGNQMLASARGERLTPGDLPQVR